MLKISTNNSRVGIGIDFGNTNFRVGISHADQPFKCVPDEFGEFLIPAYLYIDENGEKVIGHAAKQQALKNSINTLCNVKELIGKTVQQLTENKDLCNIKIETNSSSLSPIFVFQDNFKYTLEEIIAIFFAKFKSLAEQFVEGQPINNVVVTVSPSFGENERGTVQEAVKIAGFTGNTRLCNAPVMACIVYNSTNSGVKNIFVFDFGGSHLGLSIYELEDDIYERIITSEYDLGGRDFDNKLMEHLGITITKDQCEKAKKELTFSTEIEVKIGENLCQITRSKFEDLSSELFDEITHHIDEVLQQSGLKIDDFCEVIIAGGASKIPRVAEIVRNYFQGVKIQNTIDPEIVEVNGAAIQADIISGNSKPMQLACVLNFTLLPMGIEVAGGFMPILIDRATLYQFQFKYLFTTSEENQTSVSVTLFEGYSPIAKENHRLAAVTLTDISPAPRGVAKIELTIKLDANDILRLIVTDIDTGKSNEFAVPYDDVRFGTIEEVEKCRADDYRELRERMEALDNLENWVYYIRNKINHTEPTIEKVIDWINENRNSQQKDEYQKKLEMIQEVFHNFIDDQNLVLPKGLPLAS